ncbi:DUF2871 domain-containing protein [Alkaliphilus oremlandii]|uniref:DUF2871 domain-containing protein n=1 Tax=Alkaliphilus oremlandii TaxID=461876 RepID=UPI002FE61CE7
MDLKKILNTSFFYAILAMVAGVFYREFTKFNDFTGKTTLAVMHVHLFVLGVVLLLIMLLLEKQFNLTNNKKFNQFYIVYNIGLMSTVTMFLIRGITQVRNIEITKAMSSAISGIAGISHITLGTGIIMFFLILKKSVNNQSFQ